MAQRMLHTIDANQVFVKSKDRKLTEILDWQVLPENRTIAEMLDRMVKRQALLTTSVPMYNLSVDAETG
jgi:hypothetical protein